MRLGSILFTLLLEFVSDFYFHVLSVSGFFIIFFMLSFAGFNFFNRSITTSVFVLQLNFYFYFCAAANVFPFVSAPQLICIFIFVPQLDFPRLFLYLGSMF